MAVTSAVIVGREITISALREWMAEIGQRTRVNVAGIGKIKTIMQIVALTVLLYQHDSESLRFYYVGETLLVAAAAMTIWSAFIYLRAAWPAMRGERGSEAGREPATPVDPVVDRWSEP
jgi:CDP-diacylglycerol--glycerol-3-phosphate 3-phosphatidyltransferase